MNTNDSRSESISSRALAALAQGNKIEAIKALREERGIGLKEAKEAVDAHVAADPVMRAQLAAAAGESRRTAMTYAGVFLGILVVIYLFLRSRG